MQYSLNGTLTGQRYIDQVIDPHLAPFIQQNGGNYMFMDDDARPHRAVIVRNRLQQAGIHGRSPDLNPTEHAWDTLGRRVKDRQHQATNPAELRQVLVQEWNAIPQYAVCRLATSMRRSCQACVEAQGGHTRY